MHNETISVIVPVYNVEKYLRQCLSSILAQTYTHLEIIVVNDGSTDKSEKIIHEFASIDSRIKIINKPNAGSSSARNAGVCNATGKYLSFIDGDDYVEPDFFEEMHAKIINEDADIVECGYDQVFSEGGDSKSIPFEKSYGEIIGTEAILENHLKGIISLVVWNKLYKTENVRFIKFVEGKQYEDILWSAEVLAHTNRICCIRSPLYHWRQRNGSITNSQVQIGRLVAVENFDQRIDLMFQYPKLHLLARARIVCECYLELDVLCSTRDNELIRVGRQHSMRYYDKHKLSFAGLMRLESIREVARYLYYCMQLHLSCIRSVLLLRM